VAHTNRIRVDINSPKSDQLTDANCVRPQLAEMRTTSAGNGEALRAEVAPSCARISQASDAVSVVRLNAREEVAEFS
jgi:hypothetical protein